MTDQDEAARIIHRLRSQYDARTPLPMRGTATGRSAIVARPGRCRVCNWSGWSSACAQKDTGRIGDDGT